MSLFCYLLYLFRSSIDSEPALVLGPLKSVQELRREQQLAEIETRRQEREKKGQEEEGTKPPVQEMVEELQGPFLYEFSYWARYYQALMGMVFSLAYCLSFPTNKILIHVGKSCSAGICSGWLLAK